jgi:hypothetical protein
VLFLFLTLGRDLWLILSRWQAYPRNPADTIESVAADDTIAARTRGRIKWLEIVAQAATFDADSAADMNVYATFAHAVFRHGAALVLAKVAVAIAGEDIETRAWRVRH